MPYSSPSDYLNQLNKKTVLTTVNVAEYKQVKEQAKGNIPPAIAPTPPTATARNIVTGQNYIVRGNQLIPQPSITPQVVRTASAETSPLPSNVVVNKSPANVVTRQTLYATTRPPSNIEEYKTYRDVEFMLESKAHQIQQARSMGKISSEEAKQELRKINTGLGEVRGSLYGEAGEKINKYVGTQTAENVALTMSSTAVPYLAAKITGNKQEEQKIQRQAMKDFNDVVSGAKYKKFEENLANVVQKTTAGQMGVTAVIFGGAGVLSGALPVAGKAALIGKEALIGGGAAGTAEYITTGRISPESVIIGGALMGGTAGLPSKVGKIVIPVVVGGSGVAGYALTQGTESQKMQAGITAAIDTAVLTAIAMPAYSAGQRAGQTLFKSKAKSEPKAISRMPKLPKEQKTPFDVSIYEKSQKERLADAERRATRDLSKMMEYTPLSDEEKFEKARRDYMSEYMKSQGAAMPDISTRDFMIKIVPGAGGVKAVEFERTKPSVFPSKTEALIERGKIKPQRMNIFGIKFPDFTKGMSKVKPKEPQKIKPIESIKPIEKVEIKPVEKVETKPIEKVETKPIEKYFYGGDTKTETRTEYRTEIIRETGVSKAVMGGALAVTATNIFKGVPPLFSGGGTFGYSPMGATYRGSRAGRQYTPSLAGVFGVKGGGEPSLGIRPVFIIQPSKYAAGYKTVLPPKRAYRVIKPILTKKKPKKLSFGKGSYSRKRRRR